MRLRKKLQARQGMTLSELLVALLVLSLLMTAVMIGISAAGGVRRDSTKVSRTQMLMSTLSQAVSDELRFAHEISVDGAGGVTYFSPNFGGGAALLADDDGHLAVKTSGKDPMALVGSGVYGSYTAAITVRYVTGEGCFDVTLTVSDSNETVREQRLYIRALNPPA